MKIDMVKLNKELAAAAAKGRAAQQMMKMGEELHRELNRALNPVTAASAAVVAGVLADLSDEYRQVALRNGVEEGLVDEVLQLMKSGERMSFELPGGKVDMGEE